MTGARRSQAARLTVADLQNGRAPRLMMPSSLKGKGVKRIDRKPVPIPASLADKLRQAAGDRSGDALLLLKPDGSAWGGERSARSVPPRGRKGRARSRRRHRYSAAAFEHYPELLAGAPDPRHCRHAHDTSRCR